MADRERNGIVNDILAMLSDNTSEAEALVRTEYSIYKVPDQIRQLNGDAYTPKFVSIGPFHRSSENSRKMEIHKKKYFKEFLERAGTNLYRLVSRVEELEPQVRRSYSENIEYSKEEFVKMILVDAGFILGWVDHVSRPPLLERTNDALLEKRWLINDIIYDLLLLENQLPFFVFQELSDLAFTISQILQDLRSLMDWNRHKRMEVLEYGDLLHFTDLLRESCLRRPYLQLPERFKMFPVLSATELLELGVKFKADEKSQSQLALQFSYKDGILRIPQLLVNAGTEKLFRNMIALEHCHYPHEPYITDYVFLLSCLIKTDEDADFLIKNRIIVNRLHRSNNVTRLFHSLGENAAVVSSDSDSAYGLLSAVLNDFCDQPMTRFKAAFRRDYYWDLTRNYCKTPLQTLATLGGILLIILAVIQAVCSILQVKLQVM